MRQTAQLAALTALLLAAACVPATAPAPETLATSGSPAAVTRAPAAASGALGEAVNALRADAGLPALARSGALDRVARGHLEEIARSGSLTHRGADGSSSFTRIRRLCGAATTGAENLMFGSSSAQSTVSAWMGSPGHRRNMLDGDFTTFGYAETGGYWVLVLADRC